MGKRWNQLLKTFESAFGSFDVTRRALTLGDRDSVTGWRKKSYSETTIKMIVIPRGATKMMLQAGTFVTLDGKGLTITAVKEGDEIQVGSIYYEVKAPVEVYSKPGTVEYYNCDLAELPLHG